MIIVNTQKSYPPIARSMLGLSPDSPSPVTVGDALQKELADATRGYWPNLNDAALEANADYLLGTCNGVVTVAYRITGFERTEHSKLRFEVEPALELAFLIGRPQPDGPWKRGEARGVRQMETPALPDGVVDMADFGTWVRSVLDAAFIIERGEAPNDGELTKWMNEQWNASLDMGKVRVSSRRDGTIVVDVPAGHSVLIRTDRSEDASE